MNYLDFFGRRRNIKTPNFYIGGVGQEMENEIEVATMFNNINASDIELFSVDANNNIEFFIDKSKNVRLESSYFSQLSNQAGYWFNKGWGRKLTYFIDDDSLIKNIPLTFFAQQRNLRFVKLEGSTYHGQRSFQDVQIRHYRFPNLISNDDIQVYRINPFMERYYAPNVLTKWGISNSSDGIFAQNDPFTNPKKAYCDSSILTSNSGSPDGDLQYLLDYGYSSVIPQNTTPPNPVSNIQISNITSNSVDVTFTQPIGSANAIDFYDVFASNGEIIKEFEPHQEETTTSFTVSNLNSNTSYKIKIRANDIYWNQSEIIESQSFQTL